MKKLLLLLLLIPGLITAQTIGRLPYWKIQQSYQSQLWEQYFSGDSIRHTTNKGFYSFDKPIYSQGHLLGSGSGSTVYANNGLYKDGDTVKLGGIINAYTQIGTSYANIFLEPTAGIGTASYSYSGSATQLSCLGGINKASLEIMFRGYQETANTDFYVNADTSGISLINSDVQVAKIDSSGNASFSGKVTSQGIYAGIYVTDGSTAQTITTGTTYTKMTCFASNGLSSNCTSDQANDKITITKTGKYYLNWSMSASAGTNNVVWTFTAFKGGTELASPHAQRKITTAGDVGDFIGQGFINVTSVPVDIDLRVHHDNGSSITITPIFANLTVQYVGE